MSDKKDVRGKIRRKKEKMIKEYLKPFMDRPKQGTTEWLEARKKSFGGSELPTLFFENKHKSPLMLLKNKTGLVEDKGNQENFSWGHFFEEVLSLVLEEEYDCTLFEAPSVDNPKYPKCHYSLDRIGVIDGEITLIEQKSPVSRILTGAIPEHYYSQPTSGACILEITERIMFSEGVFKLSKISNLKYSSTKYIKEVFSQSFYRKPVEYQSVMKLGVVLFEVTNKKYKKELTNEYFGYHRLPGEIFDLAKNKKEFFPMLLRWYKTHSDDGVHIYIKSFDRTDHIGYRKFIQEKQAEGKDIISVLGWKMFEKVDHFVDVDEKYLKDRMEFINTAGQLMDDTRAQPKSKQLAYLQQEYRKRYQPLKKKMYQKLKTCGGRPINRIDVCPSESSGITLTADMSDMTLTADMKKSDHECSVSDDETPDLPTLENKLILSVVPHHRPRPKTSSSSWKSQRIATLEKHKNMCRFCGLSGEKWMLCEYIDDSKTIGVTCPICKLITRCDFAGKHNKLLLCDSKLSQMKIVQKTHTYYKKHKTLPEPKDIDPTAKIIMSSTSGYGRDLRKTKPIKELKGFFTKEAEWEFGMMFP